ncbi:MAG: hypothetical protein RI947_1305 [Candidatus Parcubacteria bacterium]|jgi:dolichol-phosphate mannosyltransferase
MRNATIVIPTYNEAGNIEAVVEGIYKTAAKVHNWEIHILVVDSNSEDKTGDKVRALQKKHHTLHLLETEKEGLGKAYIAGFQYAISKLNAYLIFEMDADLQHDVNQFTEFLTEIENGADFVIGSRYIKGGEIPKEWGLHRKLFSLLGNIVIRAGFMKLSIRDWTDGYRAVKTWVIKDSMSHIKNYSGYVFQIALLDYAVKHKARIVEIPTRFGERGYGTSKINAIQYIAHILLYILLNSSFIKFVAVGGLGFVLDFGISYLLIERLSTSIVFATVISTETAIVSNFLLNNYWSFAHKKLEHNTSKLIQNFLKFNFVSAGSIVIQSVGLILLTKVWGEQWWFIYKFFIILFVIIPYSYVLYNKVIWKDKG